MKAIITSASEVEPDGTQAVAYDIIEKGAVVASSTLHDDVDLLKEQIKQHVAAYELKFKSVKRLKVGDEIN